MLTEVQPSAVQVFDRLPNEQRDRGTTLEIIRITLRRSSCYPLTVE